MNAVHASLSSTAIGWKRLALAASVTLHVAAAIPLFLPMAAPMTEVTPPLAITAELVLSAEEPAAAPPLAAISTSPPAVRAPLPASPRPAKARTRPVRSPPTTEPVVAPPATPATPASDNVAAPQIPPQIPAQAGAAEGKAAAPGAGTRETEARNGGGKTGKEEEVSVPGYALGAEQTPAPDYPWSARRRGIEGRVVLRLEVGNDGRPTGVELVHGSGNHALDQAAIITLWHWRLRPAMAGGVPVAGRLVVPIVFKLT